MSLGVLVLALTVLGAHAACATAHAAQGIELGATRGNLAATSRRLLAVRDGGRSSGTLFSGSGAGVQAAAASRLCVLQCQQHACISWHKIYMGSDSGNQQPAAVPAAAAECMAQCGMPEHEAGCLAQTFQRLLNTSPLQYSCSSSCITGLLHSSCSQCSGGGGGSGCQALELGGSLQAAECLVDAAV